MKYFSGTTILVGNYPERLIRLGFGLIFSLFLLNVQYAHADPIHQTQLEAIHQRIVSKFPDVKQISASAFERISADTNDVVVFDVREQSEFEVSHLDGAIQVDPDIKRSTFNQLYGDTLVGKTVIFYCSVGRRSSTLADRVGDDLAANGSKEVYSLQYGIFGWHNDRRALVNETAKTDFIHPYSSRWSYLIERSDQIRYSAE